MAVALLGSPATAAAMTTTGPVPGAPVALAHVEHAVHQEPAVVSNRAGTSAQVRVAASDPTDAARASAASGSGLVTRLGEARRANGVLGQWVVAVLLGIVIVLWVTLVAAVVRVRLRVARSAGSNAGGTRSETSAREAP